MVDKQEPAHKPTFYDLRVKHGGNIGHLAQVSGVEGCHVHAMLLNRGVTRSDAERILTAFNRLNNTIYTLEDIQVHLLEEDQEQESASEDRRPTFRQICEQTGMSWVEVSRGAAVPETVGYQMYKGDPVFVEDCDDLLAVLSDLSGETWTRAEVGGIRLRSDTWNNPRPKSSTCEGK
ncbi:MAG: hypothetical protein JO202_10610 [Ktedonobacteraceae bacterium]|nr:hypothetical protein [Ktedonobacteraceae bacterium]